MDFILGCNYWASNAGIEMWKEFDLNAIEKDLSILSENGIKYLRVFPSWRDFQPASPIISSRGAVVGYTGSKENYYLDNTMLDKFDSFLDVCHKYGIKVIVGLVTGFMSGSMLIPPALYNKNILTDCVSQYFQQLYIKGVVSRFKGRDEIIAWDLGNECNEMENVKNPYEAANWTALVSNAVRACDNTRPIMSGMHYLNEEGNWRISDQAEFCDVLTTHPYPFWCEGTRIDATLSLRNTAFPAVYTKYYAEIGKRPCLAEEMGTMGPMVCNDNGSADFLRANLFSLWANNSLGAMWWCSSDQTELNTYPYTSIMVERELGLLRNDHTAKPALKEFKKFKDFLDSLDFDLPCAEVDGVCILTCKQRHWDNSFMSYILAKQAGLNISFEYCENELPVAPIYLMPSISNVTVMSKDRYEQLKKRVYEGAKLYISLDDVILAGFEELTGLCPIDSYDHENHLFCEIDGDVYEFSRKRNLILKALKANVLAYDNEGNPFITENNYGKGKVYIVNAPIEASLYNMHDAFDSNKHLIYKKLFKKDYIIKTSDTSLFYTLHKAENGYYVCVINHSSKEISAPIELAEQYKIDKAYYGDTNKINAYDACVFKIVLKNS